MKLQYRGYDESNFWLAFSSTTCYYNKEGKFYKNIVPSNDKNRVSYETHVGFFLEVFRRRVDIYTPMKWSKLWAKL